VGPWPQTMGWTSHLELHLYLFSAAKGTNIIVKVTLTFIKVTQFISYTFIKTGLQLLTLGARGHLPGGYIANTLRVLKQFAHTLPSGPMPGTFEKYPSIRLQKTHWVKCRYFLKELCDSLRTYPAGPFWVLSKSAHQFACNVPSG
jgi:hypothetical protein